MGCQLVLIGPAGCYSTRWQIHNSLHLHPPQAQDPNLRDFRNAEHSLLTNFGILVKHNHLTVRQIQNRDGFHMSYHLVILKG
jgi:hypothetical protein